MSEYIIKAADWAIDYKGESLYKGCEEVVRCRDCAFCNDEGVTQPIYFCLNDFFTQPGYAFPTDPDGYCWRGVRRDA